MFDCIKNIFSKSSVDNKAANGEYFNHRLNDSLCPIIVTVDFPTNESNLKFHTTRFNNKPVPENHKHYRAANAHAAVALSLNQMNYIAKNSKVSLGSWPTVKSLEVNVNAGRMLNAYYNRNGIYFFHEIDPVTRERIYTGDSTDIVVHELGHAILDAMRPDFWSVQALEIWSFHEAFSDITSMLYLMQFDDAIEHALEETNGTMTSSNNISRLAEEMGVAIQHLITRKRYVGNPIGLRDAVNDFKYIDPNKLPKEGPDNKLVAECHSFGRVFAGAWYELFTEIYQLHLSEGDSKMDAFKKSRDISATYLMKAIPKTPRVVKYHDALARVILSIDRTAGGKYQNIIKKVWDNRNLIIPRITMLSDKKIHDVTRSLTNSNYKYYKHEESSVIVTSENKITSLSDALYNTRQFTNLSTSVGNLMDVKLEIASDKYYEFDKNGKLIEEISTTNEESLSEARHCVNYIHYKQDVDKTNNTQWEVSDGKLVRTYID